jgi:hypothetical protein
LKWFLPYISLSTIRSVHNLKWFLPYISLSTIRSVHNLWDGLYVRLLSLVPGFPSDRDLLWLAFPPCPLAVERLVVAHLGVLVAEIWETRSFLRPPSRAELAAAFRGHFPALRCLF